MMRICLMALMALLTATAKSVPNDVGVSSRAHGGDDAGSPAGATVPLHKRRRDQLLSSLDGYDNYGDCENYKGEPTGLNQSAPLIGFQPAAPVLGPDGAVRLAHPPYIPPSNEGDVDAIVLVQHKFERPKPFVVDYTPPNTTFNRVLLNLSVSTEGFQRDHIGSLYLGDVEVWRMSTVSARPGQALQWGFLKDMTAYLALWRQPQQIVLDLPNSVDNAYTGSLNVTITARFFYAFLTKDQTPHPPADVVLPLSAERSAGGAGSAWKYPQEQASSMVELPRNVNRAHVAITATGREREEYWWSNVPESRTDFFVNSSGVLPGGSGVREVRLSVDGYPAGIAWPFPAVLAGGIAAPMNRPAAPLQAFDLRESEIDISVWLPYLCDGQPHNFTLDIFQFNDAQDGSRKQLRSVKVETNHWLVSAKIFLWLDDDKEAITTGSVPVVEEDMMRWKLEGNMTANTEGENHGLTYDMRLYRLLRLRTRRVTTQNGTNELMWQQQFEASSRGFFNREMRRGVHAVYEGKSGSFINRAAFFHESFEYPIHALVNYLIPDSRDGSFKVHTQLSQTMVTTIVGKTAFVTGIEPWVMLAHERNLPPPRGSCTHFTRRGESTQVQNANGTIRMGHGDMEESFRFGATPYHIDHLRQGCNPAPLLYRRDVVMNKTRFRDRVWTSELDRMYDHEIKGISGLMSSLEQKDHEAALLDKLPSVGFAPIEMDGGAWKVFMGVPLDAL